VAQLIEQSERLDTGGTSLHLTVYGVGPEAPTILFLPGMTGHAGLYAHAIPGVNYLAALAAEGFNVVGLDLPGHGRSGGVRGLFTYGELVEAVSRAVDWAAEAYNDRIGVTGSSMGGILAFYAALEDRRIRAVVCHNVVDLRDIRPILYLKRHAVIVPLTMATRFIGRHLTWLPIPVTSFLEPAHVFDRPEHVRLWKADPLCVWSYRCSSWISLFLSPADKPAVEGMETPVRILVGEHDQVLQAPYHRAFYRRLSCPKDLVVVPGVGHMLPLEHLESTVPLVTGWFREHLGD
jgi:alpha-beta hydrolase superfamily lysophospholipase